MDENQNGTYGQNAAQSGNYNQNNGQYNNSYDPNNGQYNNGYDPNNGQYNNGYNPNNGQYNGGYNQNNYGPNGPYNQNSYGPYQGQPVNYGKQDPVSLGNWMVTILLMMIPVVNIIMLIIWAADSSTEPSKKNWARAQLIWTLIAVVIWVIIIAVAGTAVFSIFNAYNG